jgi:hypothetical protein
MAVSEIQTRTRPKWLLFAALCTAAGTYAAVYRTWSDILMYAGIATACIWFFFAFVFIEDAGSNTRWFERLAIIPAVGLLAAPLGFACYSFAVVILDLFQWLVSHLSRLSTEGRSAAAAMAATVVAGGLFFLFRLRYRFTYGITEAIVGVAVAGHRVASDPALLAAENAELYLAILTAGVYLVVRGLDNVHQAWKAGTDPTVAWVRQRVHRQSASRMNERADEAPPSPRLRYGRSNPSRRTPVEESGAPLP